MKLVFADEALAIVVPVAAYWVYSGMYMALGRSMDQYRLHPREEERSKNLVPKRDVVKGVLLQQLLQAAVAAAIFMLTAGNTATAAGEGDAKQRTAWRTCVTVAMQVAVGMAVLDGWQYAWHRYMHRNKFLYRHIHSWHHRLVVPYAFGAQYNHPVEGLLLDTAGGALAFLASGMSPRVSIFFFTLCTVKGVDDHCGLWLPGNVFRLCFWNNTAYHDVHHQPRASRYNFSQPFFVTWDKVFGTHMPYVVEKRPQGGLHVRPMALTSTGMGE
ncbi:sphinganine C4-monooxygenase 1-like [Triticum urartu]|uniref:sphinganine C4-monooxygenase 1-like n=1 Tax=Triticum urartu TaxID=4572 RepID=UPI002043EA4B|nr:sphinganine C4-monooxygenase 1-like [Triticum urartu]